MNSSLGSEAGVTHLSAAAKIIGRFYVFEGIDGGGKSTIARMLSDKLATTLGRETVLTAEPSGSWIGDCVRRANKDNINDFAEALLFMADRAQHTQEISRAVEEGKIVICDRYYISTLAYQGVTLERLVPDPVLWLRAVNAPIIRRPDITFYFEIDPEMAMKRMKHRDEKSKFEKLGFLNKVAAIYKEMSISDPSAHIIDASRPLEDVFADVLEAVQQNV
ncbi:MAG: dTMP kinase [Methanomassiliicoccales archaeon]